jgi:hypothetical protein
MGTVRYCIAYYYPEFKNGTDIFNRQDGGLWEGLPPLVRSGNRETVFFFTDFTGIIHSNR